MWDKKQDIQDIELWEVLVDIIGEEEEEDIHHIQSLVVVVVEDTEYIQVEVEHMKEEVEEWMYMRDKVDHFDIDLDMD